MAASGASLETDKEPADNTGTVPSSRCRVQPANVQTGFASQSVNRARTERGSSRESRFPENRVFATA